MRRLSLEEIRNTSTKQLIAGLRMREFSILTSLGFWKLRAGMIVTGLVCRLIICLTGLTGELKGAGLNGIRYSSKAYKRTVKLLKIMTPVDCYGLFPHPECGMVVGFNHPSLGEILRFIYICIVQYKYQRNLFPVNLPWFEALMPIVNELEALGIYVMPILTPSTRNKMAKKADKETLSAIDSLATSLNLCYLEKCAEFIKDDDNVWVAPSATRQQYVFKTAEILHGDEKIEPQTMTLLASALIRSKVQECVFLAVCDVPPQNYKRGLNLFRTYRVGVGEALSMQDARDNVRKRCEKNTGRKFEEMFLMNIAKALIATGGGRFVCPFEEN